MSDRSMGPFARSTKNNGSLRLFETLDHYMNYFLSCWLRNSFEGSLNHSVGVIDR